MHIHWITEKRIKKKFTTGLSPESGNRLFEELDKCSRCAGFYNGYHKAENAPCGANLPYGIFDIERLEAAILKQVDVSPPPLQERMYNIRSLAGATAITFLVIALIVFLQATPRSHRTPLPSNPVYNPIELAARGSRGVTNRSTGFRVLRVDHTNSVHEKTTIAKQDLVTFTYSYMDNKIGYLSLFGIQKNGELIWYYPDYDEKLSMPIAGNKVDEPLGDGFDLTYNHVSGTLCIFGVFSDEPLETNDIEEHFEASFAMCHSLSNIPNTINDTPITTHYLKLNITDSVAPRGAY